MPIANSAPDAALGFEALHLERGDVHAVGQHGRIGYRRAALPAVARQVVGDRGQYVRARAPQVDPAVAVTVDRVLRDARRHELPHAHGPGVGADELVELIGEFGPAQQEQLLQLGAEERLARRIVERERGERVERLVLADVAAVERLDAHDRDDDLGRHAVFRAQRLERVALGPVERDALVDALLAEEQRAGSPSTAWPRPAS
jgi:hypothetical protein